MFKYTKRFTFVTNEGIIYILYCDVLSFEGEKLTNNR